MICDIIDMQFFKLPKPMTNGVKNAFITVAVPRNVEDRESMI